MTKRPFKLSLAVAATVAVSSIVGCATKPADDKTSAGSASAHSSSSAKQSTAQAAGPLEVTVAKLGIKGAAAGESEMPLMGSESPYLINFSQFTVTVSEAKADGPKSIEDAKKEAEMYEPKNFKSEKLNDGWVVTYDNTGSAGANYFVYVRRDIGGKGIVCETMQSTPDQQTKAVAFCKTLAKG